MALPPGWNWRTGNVQKLFEHIWNNARRPNQPRQIFCKFWSKPYQSQYNQYFKSFQFDLIETALVHDLDRALRTLHDDIKLTIESLCREWQGVKVWPVLFVLYESANPLYEPFKIFDATTCSSFHFFHYQPELYANRSHNHYPAIQRLAQRLFSANAKLIRGMSGLVLAEIYSLNLNVVRFAPFSGSAWSAIPKFLQNNKAIVNVQNDDV